MRYVQRPLIQNRCMMTASFKLQVRQRLHTNQHFFRAMLAAFEQDSGMVPPHLAADGQQANGGANGVASHGFSQPAAQPRVSPADVEKAWGALCHWPSLLCCTQRAMRAMSPFSQCRAALRLCSVAIVHSCRLCRDACGGTQHHDAPPDGINRHCQPSTLVHMRKQ